MTMDRRRRLLYGLMTATLLATQLSAGHAHAAETMGPVTDEIGVVKIAKGQPIQIGGILVLSGPDLSLGTDSSRGIELAIDAKEGTLLGHPIQYLPEDGQCSVEGGQTAATRLAANKQVLAVLGTSCSSESRGGAPILWNAGMPALSVSATAPALTAADRPVGFQGIARFVYNDLDAASAAVKYAQEGAKVTKVATLHDGSLYAEQIVRVFEEKFKAAGGTITAQEAVGPNDTDLRPVLTRMGTTGPEMIFAPIFVGASAYLVRQAKEIPSLAKVQVLGTDAVLAPAFIEAAGDSVVGYRLTGIDNDPSLLGQRYVDFKAAYKEKFGEDPIGGFHANGYDAAGVLMAAIEKVAKTDAEGSLYVGRKALRDAVMTTKDFSGLTGTLTCDANGDCGAGAFAVFEYTSSDPTTFEAGKNPKKVFP